jgi:hypothetical protein
MLNNIKYDGLVNSGVSRFTIPSKSELHFNEAKNIVSQTNTASHLSGNQVGADHTQEKDKENQNG